MAIRAVILDFDGVINDSASLNSAGKRLVKIVRDSGHKIPEDIRAKLKNNWGMYGPKIIKISFGLDLKIAEKIYVEWEKIDQIKPLPLVRGSKQVMETL